MNLRNIHIVLFILTLSIVSCSEKDDSIVKPTSPQPAITILAFPGAEGAGRFTLGGRAGKVIYVTNLNDNGPGSFREAVLQKGHRTVVFSVSGTIELLSTINIIDPYLTIAGQTAPGDGITLKNWNVLISANHVIVQFIRFRMGDQNPENQSDALGGNDQYNVIIDHCSMSWSVDECTSFYDNTNFTMQWCIIAESLRNSQHAKGTHGFGGIWGGKNASFHHNLLACHDSRNPRFCGSRYSNQQNLEKVEFVNNVIYNWGGNSGYAGEGGSYNMINNYYKPGPASGTGSVSYRIFEPYCDSGDNAQPAGIWGKFYVDGNYMYNNSTVTSNNWNGGIQPNPSVNFDIIKLISPVSISSLKAQSAIDAFNSVMLYAGASYARDTVDKRIIHDTKTGTITYPVGSRGSLNGLIDTPSDVGGWPLLSSLPAPTDTDLDGIPNSWEDANGLDKNKASDGNLKTLDPNNEYTNLEIYLHSLVSHLYPTY